MSFNKLLLRPIYSSSKLVKELVEDQYASEFIISVDQKNSHQQQQNNQKMINPQIEITQINEKNQYQNIGQFIGSQTMINIQRIVTEKLEQKYKSQYEDLLECLTINIIKYFNLQKQNKYLLEVIRKIKEQKLQDQHQHQGKDQQSIKKSQSLQQIIEDLKNIQNNSNLLYQNIGFKTKIKKKISQIRQNRNKKFQKQKPTQTQINKINAQLSKINFIISEKQTKTSYFNFNNFDYLNNLNYLSLLDINDQSQNKKFLKQFYSVDKIKWKITKLNYQLEFLTKFHQKSIQNPIQNNFPFALKHKLRNVYQDILKYHEENKTSNHLYKTQTICNYQIDNTLKKYDIKLLQFSFKEQFSLKFVSAQLECYNMQLVDLTEKYFKNHVKAIKQKIEIICRFLTQHHKVRQANYGFFQDLVGQIQQILKEKNKYIFSFKELTQIAKTAIKQVSQQLQHLLDIFAKILFIKRQIQKENLKQFSVKYELVLFFIQNLRKDSLIYSSFRYLLRKFNKIVQVYCEQILFLNLRQQIKQINKIQQEQALFKIVQIFNTNFLKDLDSLQNNIRYRIYLCRLLKNLIFLSRYFVSKQVFNFQTEQNKKFQELYNVKIFIKHPSSNFLKKQIQKQTIIGFIVLEEFSKIYSQQNQIRFFQRQDIRQKTMKYYQEQALDCNKLKIQYFNKFIKVQKKENQIEKDFPSMKNLNLRTIYKTLNKIFHQSVYKKIFQALMYYQQLNLFDFVHEIDFVEKLYNQMERKYEQILQFLDDNYYQKIKDNTSKKQRKQIFKAYIQQFELLGQFFEDQKQAKLHTSNCLPQLINFQKFNFFQLIQNQIQKFQGYLNQVQLPDFVTINNNQKIKFSAKYYQQLIQLKKIEQSTMFHISYLKQLNEEKLSKYFKQKKLKSIFSHIKTFLLQIRVVKANLLNFWRIILKNMQQKEQIDFANLRNLYNSQFLSYYKFEQKIYLEAISNEIYKLEGQLNKKVFYSKKLILLNCKIIQRFINKNQISINTSSKSKIVQIIDKCQFFLKSAKNMQIK